MYPPVYQQNFPQNHSLGVLPQWAKVYRIILMVFHAVMLLNFAVFVMFAMFPGEFTTSNPNKAIPWLLILSGLFLMAAIIPYVITNIVYGILWLTKIRGRKYVVSKLSSGFLIAVPSLAALLTLFVWVPYIIKN